MAQHLAVLRRRPAAYASSGQQTMRLAKQAEPPNRKHENGVMPLSENIS